MRRGLCTGRRGGKGRQGDARGCGRVQAGLGLRERLADAASDRGDALVLLRELLDGREEVLVARHHLAHAQHLVRVRVRVRVGVGLG